MTVLIALEYLLLLELGGILVLTVLHIRSSRDIRKSIKVLESVIATQEEFKSSVETILRRVE